MAQNTSSAVMQQRHEPHKSLDDFPTPPWATRALLEWLIDNGVTADDMATLSVREPCANRGYMVSVLNEYFATIDALDICDYGAGFRVQDYLFGPLVHVDWTIMNPPFRLAEQFLDRAFETSDMGVAMIVRSAFLEGQGRWRSLFSTRPPSAVLQFSERVVMHKGKVVKDGSTATAYCWLVWDCDPEPRNEPPEFHWIPPLRRHLEKPGDYDKRGLL